MNKNLSVFIVMAVAIIGYAYFASKPASNFQPVNPQTAQEDIKAVVKDGLSGLVNQAHAARFDYLSKNGNSSCSAAFRDSIASMPDDARLAGSCCSPMNLHRYSEQVEGLKKYVNIPEIPPDPYDIEARLAKMLMSHYNDQLSTEQQKAYDYAMQNSHEKGPCCCKCWRWNAYGGLAKILITKYNFTGEQVTDVWNLSDGCGGASNEHQH